MKSLTFVGFHHAHDLTGPRARFFIFYPSMKAVDKSFQTLPLPATCPAYPRRRIPRLLFLGFRACFFPTLRRTSPFFALGLLAARFVLLFLAGRSNSLS